MTDPNDPPCECPGPGFCSRYQIDQQEYPWTICRGDNPKGKAYRQKWARNLAERSKGGPSLARRLANVAGAAARATMNLFRSAPPEVQEARSAVCGACEFNDKTKTMCVHPDCGCYLKRILIGGLAPSKLEVASERCPMGKWGAV